MYKLVTIFVILRSSTPCCSSMERIEINYYGQLKRVEYIACFFSLKNVCLKNSKTNKRFAKHCLLLHSRI